MLRLSVPDISQDDIDRAVEVIRSGFLVSGRNVQALEEALARYIGVKHAILVSSGTAALHIGLLAMGIGPGDAVLVPDFTFPASANTVEVVGATALLCDVEADTYNISLSALEETIAACRDAHRIKAVMPVHEFGAPADLDAIYALARSRGWRVIEDAACALGTAYKGGMLGSMGDIACFSLHPRKALTTGEGGVITTNDDAFARKARLLLNHGMDRTPEGIAFVEAGLNYRLTDFQAALGLGQLESFPQWMRIRRDLVRTYFELLGDCPGIRLPRAVPGHSWQTFMVVLDERVSRKSMIEALRARDIEANLGAYALHAQPYYANKYARQWSGQDFSCAQRLHTHGLAIPFHHGLSKDDMAYVAQSLRQVMQEALSE